MGRIRTIKPDFFRHEALQELQASTNLPVMLVFEGLWTQADREGRFKWAPRILKLDILPFLDFSMEATLAALATAAFVRHYKVDDKEFGDIPSWSRHQVINVREAQSTIPPFADASMCVHVQEHDKHVRAGGEGKGREEERGKELVYCAALVPSTAFQAPPVILIPLNDGTEYGVCQGDLDEWRELFPAVDVLQQLRSYRAWSLAKPKKRKTRRGIKASITSWLADKQDRGTRRETNSYAESYVSPATQRQRTSDDAIREAAAFIEGADIVDESSALQLPVSGTNSRDRHNVAERMV